MKDREDRKVVDAFVAYLEANGHPGVRVDMRPEDENRNSPDIDAIAGPFAIEHTSLDTVGNQSKVSVYFNKVFGGIREELRGNVPFRLRINVECSGARVRQTPSCIREAMKAWILAKAPSLPDGHQVIVAGNITGLPFGVDVWKSRGLTPGIIVRPTMIDDASLPTRIRKQLDKRATKLANYAAEMTTILLVESSDGVNMDQGMLLGI